MENAGKGDLPYIFHFILDMPVNYFIIGYTVVVPGT